MTNKIPLHIPVAHNNFLLIQTDWDSLVRGNFGFLHWKIQWKSTKLIDKEKTFFIYNRKATKHFLLFHVA